jgi:hypothetical protein
VPALQWRRSSVWLADGVAQQFVSGRAMPIRNTDYRRYVQAEHRCCEKLQCAIRCGATGAWMSRRSVDDDRTSSRLRPERFS